jgi:hypothetical protein
MGFVSVVPMTIRIIKSTKSNDRSGLCSNITIILYLRGTRFESSPGNGLSHLRLFVFFPTSSVEALSWLKRQGFWLLFAWCPDSISAGTQNIMTEVFRGFLRSLQVNVWVLSQIWLPSTFPPEINTIFEGEH